jgi:hypothetical protein
VSIKIMSMVWEHYPAGGGDLLMALACADHAHDDGTSVRPSVGHLARKTRQSTRTVQRQLSQMRASGWLIQVRNGHGGRGHAAEYRINPLWITNPVNLAPFAENAGTRASDEAEKGDAGGMQRVTQVAPQPPLTIIEPTTTPQTGSDEPDSEQIDGLIWPRLLTEQERVVGAAVMESCPPKLRQQVLDEVAGLADRGAVRHPMGLISKLVDAARRGRFVPSAALDWKPKRLAMARAVRDRERQLRERRDPGPDEGNPAMREAARAKIAELTHQMRLTRPDRGLRKVRGA